MPARIDHHRTPPRLMRAIAVLALGVSALSACGDASGDAAGTPTGGTATGEAPESAGAAGSTSSGGRQSAAQALTATEGDFSISLDKNTLPAGAYEITVVNNGRASHDLVVEENGNDVAGTDGKIAPGRSATFTVSLDPGEYVFYCSVGNHRAMGMELTVQVT